jgi:GT2 family glycosyltransferase
MSTADTTEEPTIAPMPTLTAVIPATNSPPTLGACLDAIAAADDAPEQVVVVTEGDGPAAARNAGAADATGDIVVFVDADVLPHADAFSRIREAFDGDPGLTALFGSYDDEPADPGVVSQFRNLLHHHVHQQGAGPASTFWAGLGAVRADAFRAVGGFDAERYLLPSVEDIELGTRLVADGGRIVLDPLLQGTHLKRWTLTDMVRTDLWQRGVPWIELMLRDGSGSSALNLGWRHRASAGAAVVSALAVLRGKPGAALAGLVVLAALNAELYELLLRRQGPAGATAGVGLHAVHHVTGAVAVPVAVARHLNGHS